MQKTNVQNVFKMTWIDNLITTNSLILLLKQVYVRKKFPITINPMSYQ